MQKVNELNDTYIQITPNHQQMHNLPQNNHYLFWNNPQLFWNNPQLFGNNQRMFWNNYPWLVLKKRKQSPLVFKQPEAVPKQSAIVFNQSLLAPPTKRKIIKIDGGIVLVQDMYQKYIPSNDSLKWQASCLDPWKTCIDQLPIHQPWIDHQHIYPQELELTAAVGACFPAFVRVHASTSLWCTRALTTSVAGVQTDQTPCTDLSVYKNSQQEQSVREACTLTEDSGRCKLSSTRVANGCSVLIQELVVCRQIWQEGLSSVAKW